MQIRKHIILSTAILSLLVFCGCNGKEEEIPDAMAAIQANKMVRISTYPPRLPFEYGLDTGVQGYDVDIGDEIAKDLGFEARWVKVDEFKALFDRLRNGETEMVISTVVPNPELEQEFAFSKSYFDSRDGIARRKLDPSIKDLASLSGKTVGVGEGRPGDLFMATQQTATNVSIVKYHYLDEALGALNRGELDSVVGDEPVLAYSGYKSFPSLVTLPTDMNTYQYAVAVRKGDVELLASVNKTLDRLTESGELDVLKEKWFQDVLELAQEELKKLQEHEALKKSPKRINVVINKKSGDFKMDALDGYQLVLQGEDGSYKSGYITTNGNRGTCKFNTPIPPGDYTLNMQKIFRATASVSVPDVPKKTLSMVMDVSKEKGIDINIK